ncbi:hypothetical protein P154DRAFT_307124 [Amniculicola lignicola CBS 123094]|uniref:Uncharacterized protein n=1 Tax=Amniculicola lignicola CBS 123094 TaxID=1392246 RepID=A0A6A5W4C8_9PLEO|nr:hypothetical protein P154DRAFT_307124 [Amniculicola lignicola CBS 123094]
MPLPRCRAPEKQINGRGVCGLHQGLKSSRMCADRRSRCLIRGVIYAENPPVRHVSGRWPGAGNCVRRMDNLILTTVKYCRAGLLLVYVRLVFGSLEPVQTTYHGPLIDTNRLRAAMKRQKDNQMDKIIDLKTFDEECPYLANSSDERLGSHRVVSRNQLLSVRKEQGIKTSLQGNKYQDTSQRNGATANICWSTGQACAGDL